MLKSGITITASGRAYPDNVLTCLRKGFLGPGVNQDCWRWSSWDRAPQKPSVQQDRATPEPASLHPKKASAPEQSRAEQSLAEVRAAPAPAQIPGRQRGSNCQGSREQEDQKGAVQGLGSWSPKATTNMCLTLVGLISTAQMSARADRRERGKHGCPCWRIMRAASKEGAESSPRWALSHL